MGDGIVLVSVTVAPGTDFDPIRRLLREYAPRGLHLSHLPVVHDRMIGGFVGGRPDLLRAVIGQMRRIPGVEDVRSLPVDYSKPGGDALRGLLEESFRFHITEERDLPLSFWIDPGNATPEQIAELLVALSEVHRAAGGRGLRFQTDGTSLVTEGAEAGT